MDISLIMDLYVGQKKSMSYVADRVGVHYNSIRRRLVRMGVEIRQNEEKPIERDWLTRRYVEDGKSISEIAREVGLGYGTVWKRLKDCGVELRTPSEGLRSRGGTSRAPTSSS